MTPHQRRRRLTKARVLAPADWLNLAEAWVLLAVVWGALRLVPPGRLLARCERVARSGQIERKRTARMVRRLARTVAMAAHRHVVPMGCLPQSLVVSRMLARWGIQTHVQLGVRLVAGQLEAHAWTEWAGRAVTGRSTPQAHYAPLSAVGPRPPDQPGCQSAGELGSNG
jgi:hypothetical protein